MSDYPCLSPFWIAARGDQVINCELLVPGEGQAILRCGCGPQAVIRSQFIVSADAAAEIAATWKTALEEQGFGSCSPSKIPLISAPTGSHGPAHDRMTQSREFVTSADHLQLRAQSSGVP